MQPGELLSTACGSPSYVAPEVITHKSYDGAPADVWSCGVILFELLAGHPPFEDRNLLNLYKKISIAEYKFPPWFTMSQKELLTKLLNPLPMKRVKVADIIEDEWFKIDYKPSVGVQNEEHVNLDGLNGVFDSIGESSTNSKESKMPNFINAFQLIAMSKDLDLSGFFEQEDNDKQKTKLGSALSITETLEKIEAAAKDVSLSVERTKDSKLRLHGPKMLTRCRSQLILSAQITELTPTHCMVEISKSAGKKRAYKEFCESLSQVLKERQSSSSELRNSKASSVEEESSSREELVSNSSPSLQIGNNISALANRKQS